jgi:hypothetical protein
MVKSSQFDSDFLLSSRVSNGKGSSEESISSKKCIEDIKIKKNTKLKFDSKFNVNKFKG